jgi:hypothetical protein
MALGDVLWSSKSWLHPEAGRAFARALQLAEKLGETTQIVTVLIRLKSAANGSGQFELARELAERMLVAAERGSDRAALCVAHTRLGETSIWRARYVEAQKQLELGSSYYNEADRGDLGLMGIDAPALAAIAALLLGFPDRARQLMSEALRRLEHRDEPFWSGVVHMWGGMLGGLLRDGQACLEHMRRHCAAWRLSSRFLLVSPMSTWAGRSCFKAAGRRVQATCANQSPSTRRLA